MSKTSLIVSSLGVLTSDALGRPNIIARCVRKRVPCNGLVKKSPCIDSVGQYSMLAMPFLTQSVIKKYRMSMCRVCFPLERLPFFSSNILLMLSWCMILSFVTTPCASRNSCIHNIIVIASFTPTISASVELLVLIFCLEDLL